MYNICLFRRYVLASSNFATIYKGIHAYISNSIFCSGDTCLPPAPRRFCSSRETGTLTWLSGHYLTKALDFNGFHVDLLKKKKKSLRDKNTHSAQRQEWLLTSVRSLAIKPSPLHPPVTASSQVSFFLKIENNFLILIINVPIGSPPVPALWKAQLCVWERYQLQASF